ncbi:hypothetical protein BCV69DRAFT_299944 [Microstroma glucosiphilum]|uniref:Ig-like domain-containing protein n=1 Tax=Pseudomicrostroma glucosiphilum TaxID=1684307 RepID=A0A316U382_9BASI|nr:hypothetical protein BCV69DRAFT_299944 [Pseudomicrostroma glucosiphilum]PWN19630.1 hypothetical protein BCV69DRAFT_299944 [Pseudomicrostroma glucosiphilum]
MRSYTLLATLVALTQIFKSPAQAAPLSSSSQGITVDLPIDDPWLRRLFETEPHEGSLHKRNNAPPAPAGCRNLVDADLLDVPVPVVSAWLHKLYDTSTSWGHTICPTPQGNDCFDGNSLYAYNGIGGGRLDSMPSQLNANIYVGDAGFYTKGWSGQWPTVCMGTANIQPVTFVPSSCSTQSSTLVGGVHGTSAAVTAAIKQDTNLAIQVTTTTEQDITAGLSVTVGEDVGVEGVASESVSATASFSYEYSTTSGTSKTTTTDNQNTLSITVNPTDGQVCSLVEYDTTCTGTAPVTIPVTFVGALVAWMPDGVNTPNEPYKYITFAMQSPLVEYGADSAMNIEQTVGLSLEASGGYDISCVSDGSATIDNTGYTPQLQCPGSLGNFEGVCSANLGDYFASGALVTDSSNWAARGLYNQQFPAPGATVPYGKTQVSFQVQGPGIATASCSSSVEVSPPWEADFQPQLDVLQYPSDGSSVSAYYTVDYVGLCDSLQGGSCHVSSIASDTASGFSWASTTVGNNPQQSFKLSNGGQAWPQSDTLTFTVTCSDSYGNQGSALFYQKAVSIPQATSTVPGATSTLTLHTLTDDLETTTLTLATSTSTPLATKEVLESVDYYTTIYTRTVSKKAEETIVKTKTKDVTVTDVHKTTITAPQKTTTTQLSVAAPTTYTVFATTTPTATVTVAAKSTTTRTASTCTTGSLSRQGSHHLKRAHSYVPAVGTTTFSDPSITSTVTDSVDTYTLYTSAYTTVTDSIDTVQVTAPTSTVTDFFTAESKLYTVLTKYKKQTTVTSTLTSTTTVETTSTRVSQPPVTTVTLAPTADQSTVLKTVTRTASTVTSYVTPSLATTTTTPKCTSTSSSSKCTTSTKPSKYVKAAATAPAKRSR